MEQIGKLMGRRLVAGIPTLWLTGLFLVPFLIVLKLSFSEVRLAVPPYAPLLAWLHGLPIPQLHFANYAFLFTDALYVSSYLYSLKVAAVATLCCLLIGYPMAYAVARSRPSTRNVLLMLIVLPFWTSFLLRVYALEGIIRDNGLLNTVLLRLGLIEHPLQIMRTSAAVYLGIVYSYLPFMVLPLFATLEKLDHTLVEAAADLGSPPWRVFLDVTLPLSMPGIIAGSMLVLIPAIGEFVIPSLLGGPNNLMIGRVLWDEFFGNHDWPVASAVAIATLVLLVGPIALYQHYHLRELEG